MVYQAFKECSAELWAYSHTTPHGESVIMPYAGVAQWRERCATDAGLVGV